MKDPVYEAGLTVRRRILGDAHVNRSIDHATAFDEEFQELITRHAWADIWTRPGLDHRTRSLITIALLAASGSPGKYIWVTRRVTKLGPNSEKWI